MSRSTPSTLRVHRALTEVAQQDWDALLDGAAVPFMEWAFLVALEESGSVVPERGWHPRHLTLWQGSRLVAAAPAYLRDDSEGEFVFDGTWADAAGRVGLRYYPKLVLTVPFTPVTGRRILVAPGEDRALREAELYAGALAFSRSEGISGIHVLFPSQEELGVLEDSSFAVRLGVQYQWHNPGYRTLEDFLGRFHAKRRHQLRRELRAPAEQGITLRTLRGDELLELGSEEIFRFYHSTVDKYPWGRRLLTPEFFARLLATFRHRCEFVEARREGQRIAGAFNLVGPGVLYGRYWGCIEEHPFLHFNVCLYHPIQEAIAQGLRRFEPGAGGEHKLTRGFEPHLTYSAHLLLHPRLDRAVRAFLSQEQAAVRTGLSRWHAATGFKKEGV